MVRLTPFGSGNCVVTTCSTKTEEIRINEALEVAHSRESHCVRVFLDLMSLVNGQETSWAAVAAAA